MLVGNGFIFPQLFCPLKLINKSQILERKKINHCGRDAIFFPLICQCENFSRKKIIFQQYYDKGSFQRGGNPPPQKKTSNSAIKMQTICKKPLAKSKAQSNRCYSVVKCQSQKVGSSCQQIRILSWFFNFKNIKSSFFLLEGPRFNMITPQFSREGMLLAEICL